MALWLLGLLSPRQGGLTTPYVVSLSLLLACLVALDQTAPSQESPVWRRLAWLLAEVTLCFFLVRGQGSLVRPAIAYLLPASQAVLMFGQRLGPLVSLVTWFAYGLNVGLVAWPRRLREFPNYLSFFLVVYLIAVLLTRAAVRQAAARHRIQGLYDELRVAHQELQTLHEQVRETAVAQERNRLAREIHDTVAHYLTVVNVQLEAAEKLGPQQTERALEQVRRARRLVVECLQEARRSVAALTASTLEELSLPRAIAKLASEFAESTGITIETEIAIPEGTRLATEKALALYRVAQEGLTNVYKHAQATNVRLSLSLLHGNLELAVEDNGIGPSESDPKTLGGFGLLGLRERVELLGGQLSFGRRSSGGSRLTVIIPGGEVR